MSREIVYTDNFVKSASDRILQIMNTTLVESSFFVLSLCGGSTPFPVYKEIAKRGSIIPWERVIITFGDERCVPPTHEQSNFRAAKANFFDYIPIPESNIIRIKGELDPPVAADDYEHQLDEVAARIGMSDIMHDLMLLGMGDDGHTASLFPDSHALQVSDRRVSANYVAKLNSYRITLTFPFINKSRTIMFLVNDAKKKQVINDVLDGKGNYPSSRIKPLDGTLIWTIGGLL
jgi:6-phosphogluconolactonase